MEINVGKPAIPRPSFLSAVELTPRTGPVDATDIKKNLYGDFSSSDISQGESLESKEQIHVCLRIRPFIELDKESDAQECVSVVDSTSIILKAPKSSKMFRLSEKNLRQMVQKFTFSQVFGSNTTQEELFEGTVKQPVLDFLRGRSRLIFTYGVTNAGKTYTYQGTAEDSGILPRALDMLFKNIQGKLYPEMDLKPHRCKDYRKLTKEEMKEEASVKSSLLRLLKEVDCQTNISRTGDNCEDVKGKEKEEDQPNWEEMRDVKFSIWVSFCEIYNECIYDLLLPVSTDKRRKVLRLAQDIKGCSYVKGLQWIHVSDSKEAFKLVKLGLKHQSSAATKLNANSSRSHSIFSVKMLKIDSESTRVMHVNDLFLCDLAGSERCTRTCNEGERLKESGNINTSLLILGKCISALKTNQQSKLQQHIPFRESKLTHLFQGFFSGKGKVCMIINISQSASAYDETLNVLRFSAIAQKILLDPSDSPQETFDQLSIKGESEMIPGNDVHLPNKRATISWEGTLEDVMEAEEELVEDDSEECEVNYETEMAGQLEGEGTDIIIGKEEYQKLLSIVEELKNRLIEEKKAKLLMELKIREEVTQECLQYFTAKESDLKMIFSHKEQMMEDTCEERMKIYKELLKECISPSNGNKAEEAPNEDGEGNEGTEPESVTDFSNLVSSLQKNVADIKEKAKMAFGVLDALEEPQVTIERLEKQLADVTTELAQVREELSSRNKVEKMQENKLSESAKVLQEATEKMALQNKCIQELSLEVDQKNKEISRLQVVIGQLEAIIKDSETTIATIKEQLEKETCNATECTHCSESTEKNVGPGRKRYLERAEDGPPIKQGFTQNCSKGDLDSEKIDEAQAQPLKENEKIGTLEEKNKTPEVQLGSLSEDLENKKNEMEGFSGETAGLFQALSWKKERTSGLNMEFWQQQANCEQSTFEMAMKKERKRSEETLLQQTGATSRTNVKEKSQVITAEAKLDLLSSLGSVVELIKPKEKPRVENLPASVNTGEKSPFHCSIEGIWGVSQQIVHASSQKNNFIADLLQQIENLQKRTLEADEENSQLHLKLNETISQRDASVQEKASLLSQLRDLQQENTIYAEKYREEENRAQGYFEKLKTNEDLLEKYRTKESNVAALEQTLKDKESTIIALEKTLQDMQENLGVSETHIRKSKDQEQKLKVEILKLKKTIELQEKEKDESKQAMNELNEELSKTTALSCRLQMEVQQKTDEYANLKEKLADTKKQIEQVQRQVCGMRGEEKLLRSKVTELEKAKGQLTAELDLKQRTIQQLKKDDQSKKLEDILQQYQKACEDISSKDKIIEDMRMTLEEQEQTQTEQDQVLQARLEENERCRAELEEWEKRYHELKEQKSNLKPHDGSEKTTKLPHEEVEQLQEKLKVCQEQQKMDHKKWLAEKSLLIAQAKEAEVLRNKEMKKFAGDREYYAKQLTETEKLVTEKDKDLQKWRVERDQLVAALEVQLSSLVSSNAQKDKDIEELKKMLLKSPGNDHKTISEGFRDAESKELEEMSCRNVSSAELTASKVAEKTQVEDVHNCKHVQLEEKQGALSNCNIAGNTGLLLQQSNSESSGENIQDQSVPVLDSCEVSSESSQSSRFPKPEMEIQFTPLKPHKIEVKHQGSPSMVTFKVPKTRKRKSNSLDEMASVSSLRTGYSLRSKHGSRIKSNASPGRTLQKFGNFLQNSPTILQSKAKTLVSTVKSPKSAEEDPMKENGVQTKKAKRKLYATNIAPVEFSSQVIDMDPKESDHEIIKRRLRIKK